ncbi:MAG: hypothetical protein K2P57_06025 [Burkholderiales bacterium]|nr:hypothetical protein [Burkholderiales bacterium]
MDRKACYRSGYSHSRRLDSSWPLACTRGGGIGPQSRLCRRQAQRSKITSYARDEAGNAWQVTNRMNQVTQTTFDALNRPVQVNYLNDGAIETTTWDIFGNKQMVANSAVTYTYAYDNLNRLLSRTDSRSGRSLAFGYDPAGNLVAKADYQGDITNYVYDSANNLVGMGNTAYLQAAYQHDGVGRVLARILSSGAKTLYGYDADGHLTSLASYTASAPLNTTTYMRDRVGNIVTQVGSNGVISYGYDALYRLTIVHYVNNTLTDEFYTYDAVGNRLTQAGNGAVHAYEYGIGNRLMAVHAGSTVTGPVEKSFSWDPEGRLVSQGAPGAQTRAITWNQKNMATNINGVTYVYDPLGYRIGSSAVGDYYLDGEHLEAIYSGSQLQAKYFRGIGTDELLAGFGYVNGAWTPAIYQQDALMSVTGISSHDGNPVWSADYTAFGDRLIGQTGTSANRLQYTGREMDSTGLYYYRARYYDPTIGRFLSEDPLGFAAGINFYAYVNNNPINANDPSGQAAVIDNLIGAGIAGTVDIAAQYTQAQLAGKPFNWDWKQTGVATGFGFATSGVSALLGNGVASLGYGAGASFALRTGGNTLIGATANVGSTATMNHLEGKSDSLGSAALWGGGFGGLGSAFADSVTSMSSAINQAKINSLSPGAQNFLANFADLNGFKLGGPSSIATAGGIQLGNFVGALTAFNPGDSGASPTSFSNQSGLGGGAFPGAAGGFLLYPNKPNTNQMQSVYSKH